MEYKTISQMFYQSMKKSLDEKIIFYKDGLKWKGLTGKDALSIDLDLSFADSTQLASPFSVTSVSQDGQTVGRLDGLDIDDPGFTHPFGNFYGASLGDARCIERLPRALSDILLKWNANPC